LRAAILKEAGVTAGAGATADGGGTAGETASSGAVPSVGAAPADLRRILAGIARVRTEDLKDGTRLVEGLGLGSLDLVELTVAVEEEFGVGLPEDVLAGATVGDLERIVVAGLQGEAAPAAVPSRPAVVSAPAAGGALQPAADVAGVPLAPTSAPAARSSATPATAAAGRPGARGALRMPRWTRRAPMHALRRLLEETAYRAVVLVFARPRVEGLEHLRGIDPPFLFVGNHHSYIDSGLFKTLLPRPLRGRIAPGMTTRYHRVYFGETEGSRARYLKEWFQVKLVEFLFFAWPLPETAGVRNSLAYAGELADAGVSLLIFPEGRHVPEGTIEPFRKGIGIFARELRLPVVPVFVEGTGRVLPDEVYFPRFGRTRLVLGAPLTIPTDLDATEATRRIEAAVRALGP
ncbi:MAG TPA: 1-acyl-sn-glycerol-3-phosphate acyltransferase, partial [Methylomirabilota bacterium]|nr:1-acyl-sn-glycerol-3-phosphate acyltransferase [Methylomirabilota bacterium]